MTHFASFFDFLEKIFGALEGTQFLLCVVKGRGVALTPGVELPGVRPPGAGVSAQALAPLICTQCTGCTHQRLLPETLV